MKKILLFLSMMFLASLVFAAINVYHETPILIFSDRDTEVSLEIRSGYNEIAKINLFYRESGSNNYRFSEMDLGTETNPVARVLLKDIKMYLSGMDYYFEIVAKTGIRITSPEIQPTVNPYRATVKSDDTFEGFVVLAPDKDHSDLKKDFIIAISTFAISEQLQEDSIQLFVNGKNVTKEAKVSSNMIFYKPKKLSHGAVTYYVTAILKNGKKISSPRWHSQYRGGGDGLFAESPFEMNGQAVLNHNGYNKTTGDSLKDDNDSRTSLNLDISGRYDWLRMKGILYISSIEDKNRQPINRYSFQFNIPYFQFTLGDETPALGNFVANGRNVRGIHSKLNFRYLRLYFSTGYINRVIEGKEVEQTDETGTYSIYDGSSFQRNTIAARIELGSLTGFTYGISFAKNKDDMGSLDEKFYLNPVRDSLNTIIGYNEDNPLLRPNDNIVVGMHTDFRFYDNRLIFGAEGAMSLFNSNIIGGAIPKDSLEADFDTTIPFDPESLESFFVINKNVEPLKPNKSSLAYKAYVRAFFYRNLLDVSYSAVGGSFHSLSTTYLPTDTGILSIVDNITLLNNMLSLNGGVNLISDNIYNQKEISTSSSVIFGNIAFQPRNYPSVRFGFTVNNSKNDWSDDPDPSNQVKNEFNMVSNSFYLNFGYQLGQLPVAPTLINVGFNNNVNQDKAYELFENNRNTFSFSAKSFFRELPLTTQIAFSLSTNEDTNKDSANVLNTIDYHYSSIYLKAEYLLLDNKLKPYIDYRLTNYGGGTDKQMSNMFNIGAGYGVFANTYLTTELGLKTYSNSDEDGYEYTNFNWKMQISQRF